MNFSNSIQNGRLFRCLCGFQSIYFFVTGVWPLISIRSFQAVTGKKTDHLETGLDDHWLVMTVGLLILAVAVPLLVAAYRNTQHFEIGLLAMGVAFGLCVIDLIYTCRRVIDPIYLFDAAIEITLIALWTWALFGRKLRRSQSREAKSDA